MSAPSTSSISSPAHLTRSSSGSTDTNRLRKKERTRARILANAIALFRRAGIRHTRSLEIAAASDVSSATLFNYFPTKNDLAEAWVRGEIRACLDGLVDDAGDRRIRAGLRRRCEGLADANWAERALRLEAWRSAGRAVTPTLRHTESLERLIGREQDRGRLRADLSARVIAEMLGEAIEGALILGLRESKDARELAAGIRSRLDLVLDGARKRNERVSAPIQRRSAQP